MGLLTNYLTNRMTRTKSGSGGGGVDPSLIAKFDNDSDDIPSYHKGGTVRKTGLARLRKGERVLTKTQAKKLRKA